MSQARSFSLPLACQKTDKKKHHSLFRRLAKALPGRKKKHPRFSADTGDEYGSGNESPNQIDLPHGQFLTPSTSADSLDTDDLLHDEMGSNTSLQATVKLSPSLTVEMLKEVKTLLQNIQSDNKDSQERIRVRQKFWENKGYSGPLWELMFQEWKLLHDHHINQGKEIDNILTNLEWLQT